MTSLKKIWIQPQEIMINSISGEILDYFLVEPNARDSRKLLFAFDRIGGRIKMSIKRFCIRNDNYNNRPA